MMTIARNAFGSAAIWAIPRRTGAALARFVVKTAAPAQGRSLTIIATSGLPFFLILAATPDALKPTGRLVRTGISGAISWDVVIFVSRYQL